MMRSLVVIVIMLIMMFVLNLAEAEASDVILTGKTDGTGSMSRPAGTFMVKFYQSADATAKIERRECILKEIAVLLNELGNIKIDIKQQYKVTIDK
jgi:hypothetical protein